MRSLETGSEKTAATIVKPAKEKIVQVANINVHKYVMNDSAEVAVMVVPFDFLNLALDVVE